MLHCQTQQTARTKLFVAHKTFKTRGNSFVFLFVQVSYEGHRTPCLRIPYVRIKEKEHVKVHKYSKGWFVQQLREKGIKLHPQLRCHLGLFKESELRNLYYQYVENEQLDPE